MYKMPAEVLTAERPVIFGLSMYQVFGVMVAIAFGNEVVDNLLAVAAFAAVSIVGLTRVNSLYLAETFYYLGRHWLLGLLGEEIILDPDDLYESVREGQGRSKLIVRGQDGSKMVVSSR
jgi:hypothetical protein